MTDPAAELILALGTCLTAARDRARQLRELEGWWVGGYGDRPAGGWDLTRSLDANMTSDHETFVELADLFFEDRRAPAGQLPGLVEELLRIPPPEVAE